MKINKPQIKSYLVLCGNKAEFDYFCNQKRLEYEDGNKQYENCEFHYYSGSLYIRGRVFDEIIKYGTYYKRDDLDYAYPSIRRDYLESK